MELKEYQDKALKELRDYLARVAELETAGQMLPARIAWQEMYRGRFDQHYSELTDGIGREIPFVCLQVPTGGGKTLLAAHAVDIAKELLTKRQTGLVLWVVPTTQIYLQTLESLNTRDHPYRQVLDRASGGRTKIIEKNDQFTPEDVQENLVVLMLMMQSAARDPEPDQLEKYTRKLRLYEGDSRFDRFFPSEERLDLHAKILAQVPNLNTYSSEFEHGQIMPSFGNTIRLLQPIVILDEGHRATSTIQRETLKDFNPRAIIEFTATPLPGKSNLICRITGKDVLREDMIKLPLHVRNVGGDWREALNAAIQRLEELEKSAERLKQQQDFFVRPMCLIQVERTGKDQRESGKIHSEEVKEELLRHKDIPEHQIKIQSSEKKELNDFAKTDGLLTEHNDTRFIITKDALKEGWDCSFAYVLCLLNTPKSRLGATQLIGRILRQPYATKFGKGKRHPLDESYVVSHKQNDVIASIKKGFEDEGLSDLKRQIVDEAGEPSALGNAMDTEGKHYPVRKDFKPSLKHFILPTFVIMSGKTARPVDYESDIAPRIQWQDINVDDWLSTFNFLVDETESTDDDVTLDEESMPVIVGSSIANTFQPLTSLYIAQQIMHIVPNPWQAYELAEKVKEAALMQETEERVKASLYNLSTDLARFLRGKKEELAEEIFLSLLKMDVIRFVFFTDTWHMPNTKWASDNDDVIVHKSGQLRSEHLLRKQVQQSLFDPDAIVEQDFDNESEREVALWLDKQEPLFWWYRNFDKKGWYFLQGWKPHKVYPDFVATRKDESRRGKEDFDRVFVIETKGDHLKGNDKTKYLEQLFELCNGAKPRHLDELGLGQEGRAVRFELIHYNDGEYKNKIVELFEQK